MNIQANIRAKYSSLSHRQKKMAILSSILLCILFIILLCRCGHAIVYGRNHMPAKPMFVRQDKSIKVPLHSPLRTHMTIKTVQVSNLPHIVSLPGIIEARPSQIVNISPPLTGRLTSLNVKLGDVVKLNQVLAVISSPDLAQAYSDNEKADSMLKLTSNALKRAKEVIRVGGTSIKAVQSAENDYIQAQAEFKRTKDRLTTLGHHNFGQLTIKSPIQGRITALNYGEGSYITDPTAILMSISNLETVWVTASVPEDIVNDIKKDQRVTIQMPAFPNEVFHSRISFVNAVLEPDTRCNKTRIILKNPLGKFQPNMFATVEITVPQPSLVMLPLSSILMNDETTTVYVETAPWVFEQRVVQLGPEDGKNVRILSGLKPGTRVAMAGGIFIND